MIEAVQRFWSKVDKEGPIMRPGLEPCWVWTRGLDDWGYGVFHAEGRVYKAHRFAWMLTRGELKSPMVLHKCDNPSCVRPDHLFEGDNVTNMADMVAKGRQHHGPARGDWNRGEKHKLAKLTEDKVRAMRAKYARGEATQYELSEEYQVSQSLVNRVLLGKKWGHVRCAS